LVISVSIRLRSLKLLPSLLDTLKALSEPVAPAYRVVPPYFTVTSTAPPGLFNEELGANDGTDAIGSELRQTVVAALLPATRVVPS